MLGRDTASLIPTDASISCTPAPRYVASPAKPAFPWIGVRTRFARGQEVFSEGDRAEAVYLVVSGAVRTYRVLNGGRRQICDFLLPGDMQGLEASPHHRLSAESIGASVLLVASRKSHAQLMGANPKVAEQMLDIAVRSLRRTQDHMLILGRQSARERVCAFLLDLAERLTEAGEVELPMSRQDIADYLGMTVETVSRTFTQLRGAGWIRLVSLRRVALTNRAALARACG